MHTASATHSRKPDGPLRMRLAGAMSVSLLVHALIISLQFGVAGIGLPGLEAPWRERRAQAIELNVTLAPPAPSFAAEAPAPAAEPPSAASVPPVGLRLVPLPAAPAPKARKKRAPEKAASAVRPPRVRAKRETPVIALNEPRDNTFDMPAPAVDEILPVPAPETDVPPASVAAPEPEAVPQEDPAAHESTLAARKLAEEEEAQRAREAEEREARLQTDAEAARRQEEEAARQQALALETQRLEEAKRHAETERLALELEERKKAEEANRQAAALALQQQREEALRREREEAARRALELEEQQRAEALRLQAEKMQREAMELQARKHAEAAARERLEEELAARRKAVADAEAAKRAPAPELALGDSPAPGARIDALPRGLTGGGLAGRALEQARRGDALRNDVPASRQSDSGTEPPRRRSIFGSKDVDVGLMMYVESWRLKIERNGSIMYPRAAAEQAHGDPVVTVAVRSDGSVEEVTIHRSSGRPELDEAVHRIVRVNARYSAFPPELARRFDVIEIRKVWNFEDRLRILEEVR